MKKLRGDFYGRALLSKIGLWEILILQLVAAVAFLLDSLLLEAPISAVILPFAVALWSAVRLRNYPYLTWVNPFSVGVLASVITAAVYLIGSLFHSSWQEFFPATLTDVLGFFFAAAVLGFLEGFMALFIAAAITADSEEP